MEVYMNTTKDENTEGQKIKTRKTKKNKKRKIKIRKTEDDKNCRHVLESTMCVCIVCEFLPRTRLRIQ